MLKQCVPVRHWDGINLARKLIKHIGVNAKTHSFKEPNAPSWLSSLVRYAQVVPMSHFMAFGCASGDGCVHSALAATDGAPVHI